MNDCPAQIAPLLTTIVGKALTVTLDIAADSQPLIPVPLTE